MLAKCFPPWTVTHSAWTATPRPKVSGISADVMLFSQQGVRLVHRYYVFDDNVTHPSFLGIIHAESYHMHEPGLW